MGGRVSSGEAIELDRARAVEWGTHVGEGRG